MKLFSKIYQKMYESKNLQEQVYINPEVPSFHKIAIRDQTVRQGHRSIILDQGYGHDDKEWSNRVKQIANSNKDYYSRNFYLIHYRWVEHHDGKNVFGKYMPAHEVHYRRSGNGEFVHPFISHSIDLDDIDDDTSPRSIWYKQFWGLRKSDQTFENAKQIR